MNQFAATHGFHDLLISTQNTLHHIGNAHLSHAELPARIEFVDRITISIHILVPRNRLSMLALMAVSRDEAFHRGIVPAVVHVNEAGRAVMLGRPIAKRRAEPFSLATIGRQRHAEGAMMRRNWAFLPRHVSEGAAPVILNLFDGIYANRRIGEKNYVPLMIAVCYPLPIAVRKGGGNFGLPK